MRISRRLRLFGRAVLAVVGGVCAVAVAVLLAFGGTRAEARSERPELNDPDPPFGLYETSNAAKWRVTEELRKQAATTLASGGVLGGASLAGTGNNGASKVPAKAPSSTTASAASASPTLAAAVSDSTVPVGDQPLGVAVTNSRAYVTNGGSNSVSVLNLTTVPASVVATIPVGAFPVDVALSADASQAYVTNYNGNSLSIISTATNAVTGTVPVGSRPGGVIRIGATVYVANLTGNSISVVNPATAMVTSTVVLGGSPAIAPNAMAANAAGTRLYVTDARNGKLLVLDATVNPPTVLSTTTTVGSFPAYMSVAGTTGYVANPGSGTVSVVDLAPSTPAVTATVAVGTADYGIVAQPSLGQVFVTNSGSNNGTVIDMATNTTVGTFPTGTTPNAIVLTPDGSTAVFTNQGSDSVSVLHVNQRPVNSVPGAQSVNANGTGSANTKTFSAANSNLISVADSDAATNPIKVTLGVSHGKLKLSGITGLSFTSGADNTANMAFTGTLTDINAALAGMQFTPSTMYVGSDTLTVTTNDQGSTGIGRPQSDIDTVSINVVNVAPVAGAVTFTGAVGNTIFGVGLTPSQPETHVAGNVLANSTDANNDSLSASAGTITTANNGRVQMGSNGTFTYITAAGGATGNDTFTFTVFDGTTTTNGTATITVANRVWYVNNNLGSNGNGRSNSPFNTLTNVNGGSDADGPGDYIFLYNSGTIYGGGLALEANQRLIGQPEGLVIGAVTIVSPAGTNPFITNNAGTGIQLANDTVIRRVSVTDTSSAGIQGNAVTNVDIGPNITVSSSLGAGISFFNAASGTITVGANITHFSPSGRSFFVANRTGGTVTMTGAINDTAGGVQFNSNTGATINLTGALSITGMTELFKATGGGTVTANNASNSLNNSGNFGPALTVQSTTIGAAGLVFQSINSNGNVNGILMSSTGSGPLTVNGGTIQNMTGDAISLTNVGGAVSLTNMATTNDTGTDVLVDGGAANVTYTGTITNQSGKGRSVVVQNKMGGTVAFSGAITDNGTGILLSSNTGATINFTGGLTMSTGASAAFTATGGGTFNVTGSNNTITTTTGVALNVQNTTIGASNLNFKSISAGTAASGPTNGIFLSNTGSSGGLTVTGTGSAGSGGTIQKATNSGIETNGTRNLNLSWMTIQNNGDALNEGGLRLFNVTGTGQLTSSTVTGSFEDSVLIENTAGGTLTSFTVQGPSCFIGNNSAGSGNFGIGVLSAGTSNMTATVNNCTFSGNRTETLRGDTADSSTLNITFTNNTITAGTGGNNQGNIGINVSSALTSTLTYLVQGNKIGTNGVTNAPLMNHGINVFAGGSSTITGRVLTNTIRMAGASFSGTGIRVFQQDNGIINAKLDSNTVTNVGLDFGIDATDNGSGGGSSTGKLNIAVTNNNSSTLSAAINAIRVRGRRDTTTCARITGNTATTNGGTAGITISQANTAVYNLEMPVGGPFGNISAGQADTAVTSQNPAAVGVDASAATNFTGVAANSCSSIPT